MRSALLTSALILSAAMCFAQTAPAPAAPGQPPMASMARHGQHLQQMKAQVEKMRATLDQMKANLAKIKDPGVLQEAQSNVDLWDSMLTHMEGMVNMMSQGPAPMGMMHGGMPMGMAGCCMQHDHDQTEGCCSGMKEGAGCCGGGQCMKPGGKPVAESRID